MQMFLRPRTTRRELVKDGVISGLLEVVYIGFVSLFFSIAAIAFPDDSNLVAIGAICFLSLVVLSVAVSGILIFGYPLYYALQKKYEEALAILFVTCGTLLVVFALLVLGAFAYGITN
ncbi:MAG: hypothetical protein KBB55_02215 [Candidatus Buchananbacteria bacterium]|nr:hypothetical protein [Candidatus Buchananbacteria bacterium]